VGLKFPAWVSVSGKAMLAYLPKEEARRIASEGLRRSVSGDASALKAFLDELELTRQRGYSNEVSTAYLAGDAAARHRNLALEVARELTERLGGDQREWSDGLDPVFRGRVTISALQPCGNRRA
jgi:hypothetical protein